MHSSVRLGRVAGVEVGVNWTWLIVFGLVVWMLADVIFPSRHPGLPAVAYVSMAVVATFAFFGSILLHEFGHALQGRREGAEIEGITLWLFGGVARLRDMYRTPGAEFRIALAGPLVSVVLAGVLVAVSLLARLPVGADSIVAWLGYVNVLILAFNLLPAPPLDGGRLLHSGLWKARGDLIWATKAGAVIGQAFGWLLIAGGIALAIFTAGVLSGVWLVLIGWFLARAARREAGEQQAEDELERIAESPLGREVVLDEPTPAAGEFENARSGADAVARRV